MSISLADINEYNAHLLTRLTRKEQDVIKLRCAIGYDHAHDLMETAKILKMTRNQVFWHEHDALYKINAMISARDESKGIVR